MVDFSPSAFGGHQGKKMEKHTYIIYSKEKFFFYPEILERLTISKNKIAAHFQEVGREGHHMPPKIVP